MDAARTQKPSSTFRLTLGLVDRCISRIGSVGNNSRGGKIGIGAKVNDSVGSLYAAQCHNRHWCQGDAMVCDVLLSTPSA